MDPRTKTVIGLLLVSSFVVILNETIMSVALPRLMADLDITAGTAQWLTTGFMLTMAVVIPATGFLLQRFSMRGLFLTAMSLFSAGTLLAALAPGFGTLLGGRIIQAGGTAIMLPLLMTTVLNAVPAHKRGQMMGTISIVIAVAPAIGPTVSGIILNALDWRWMFWLVLPIALLSLGLGAMKIENLTETKRVPFDVLSIVLSTFAFGGLIFGLSSIGEAAQGKELMPLWIPLAVGVLAMAGFVLRQLVLQRTDRALMDLRTFTSKPFVVAIIMVLVSMMALFGCLIVLPLYLQNVLGLDTLHTGLLLLPGGAVMAILSPIVGNLFDRFGPRPLVVPGALVLSGALWGMTLLTEETPVGLVILMHCLLNAGLGFIFTPLFTSALGSLDKSLYSHGSAIINTLQQLAGAAGTAVFITLMTTGTTAALADGASAVSAAASGVHTAFFWGAVVSLVAVAASFLVRRPTNELPEGMAVH
ncbi:DHA2 family efflux MFS transporter permease subunit [Arthrobacter sp. zg-Y1116]|nr:MULTISPECIES: MDR family MFS transporter [unclassified Arthrobacter]MCQ1946860.1 DHA2 family efflux MFS transporter permease subunit [Arthrobacter sp. zg-Y1116]MCQ1986988.1 DHA2 family efflux MFS transporter permease subunit [Arthrobacter sp. zg-Y844]MCQ1995654.1 DHA2 family efflux MFS transporter permease subunit [Arthrobacter sp. zg-Y1171]UWX83411.1 DHA2 family efflux MFS transporter permease subunit [Arthrobacter sp. zg-Y1171]